MKSDLPPQSRRSQQAVRPPTANAASVAVEQAIFLASLFSLLWVGLLFLGRHKLFQDPGTYWHILLGRRWLDTGSLNRVDNFTFSHNGQHWLALQWLAEAVMGAVHRAWSWDGLLLLTATLLAAFYTWLAKRLTQRGVHWSLTTAILITTIAASSHHFHVRPHLASFILIGTTYALLVDVERRRAPAQRLWLLAPLFLLWTNLHGGVLGGAVTVGLAFAGWIAWNWLPTRITRLTSQVVVARLPGHTLLLILTTLFACFLVNPYGLEMPATWLAIMDMPLQGLIDEHGPLELASVEGIATCGLGLVYLLAIPRAKGKSLGLSSLVPLIWLLLAMSRVRHSPLFATLATLALAELLPGCWFHERLRKTELLVPVPGNTPGRLRRLCQGMPAILLIVTATAVGLRVLPLNAGPGADRWPLLTATQCASSSEQQPVKVFNDLDFGGYLALHQPQTQTLIDDRCELFGADYIRLYLNVQKSPELLERWHRYYGFDFVLPRAGSRLDRFLRKSANWTLVAEDRASVLFRRTAPEPSRPSL